MQSRQRFLATLALALTWQVAGAQAPAMTETACTQLAGLTVAAGSIGLPTGGAVITQGQWMAASGSGATAAEAYCLASGKIMPVDPKAPNIEFQIALPKRWNAKIVMLGGGGFNGIIPKVSGNFQNTPPNSATPLARGYAVFGSDSGHQAPAAPPGARISDEGAAFFTNAESYRNYMGDALKKTRDAAVMVIRAAYGQSPVKAYFFGGSKGGQEALSVTGRWPEDWDGVVALYPARNYTLTVLGALSVSQAMAAPGAYPNLAKRAVLYQAALEACDSLDGVKDGLISNQRGCYAKFHPATATVKGVPLRCPKGADTGDSCLSDAQLSALNKGGTAVSFDYLTGGARKGVVAQKSWPGYNLIASDLGSSSHSPLEAYVVGSTLGSTAPQFPTVDGNSFALSVSDYFMRLAVARDTGFNHLTMNLKNPGPLAARLNELYTIDQVDGDLTAFARRGGKLIILQGTDDILISARGTEIYVQGLRKTMGAKKVDAFLRYYEMPGFGHGLSTIFTVAWDQLQAIENWVEKGVDPGGSQIATDTVGAPGRTRPLCQYPAWPKYRGSGEVNAAASFHCVKE